VWCLVSLTFSESTSLEDENRDALARPVSLDAKKRLTMINRE
jgi:hypothetical protein